MDSLSIVFLLFSIYITQNGLVDGKDTKHKSDSKEEMMYKKCEDSKNLCYGENQQCIKKKSCILLAVITDTELRFEISFLDKCKRNITESLFFAAAAGTFNEKGELDCSKQLTMTDIKIFIFWKEKLCRGDKDSEAIIDSGVTKSLYKSGCEKKMEENYGKTLMNTLQKSNSTSNRNLNLYLNNFVRFSTVRGDWTEANRPFNFPKNMSYTTTMDQVFYTTVDDKQDGDNKATSFSSGWFPMSCTIFIYFLQQF